MSAGVATGDVVGVSGSAYALIASGIDAAIAATAATAPMALLVRVFTVRLLSSSRR